MERDEKKAEKWELADVYCHWESIMLEGTKMIVEAARDMPQWDQDDQVDLAIEIQTLGEVRDSMLDDLWEESGWTKDELWAAVGAMRNLRRK